MRFWFLLWYGLYRSVVFLVTSLWEEFVLLLSPMHMLMPDTIIKDCMLELLLVRYDLSATVRVYPIQCASIRVVPLIPVRRVILYYAVHYTLYWFDLIWPEPTIDTTVSISMTLNDLERLQRTALPYRPIAFPWLDVYRGEWRLTHTINGNKIRL